MDTPTTTPTPKGKVLFQPGAPTPILLTPAQAGYLLGIHANVVRNLVKGGELDAKEIGTGRFIHVTLESVIRYANSL